MTAPEREALVKDLRGESARIAEYAAPNGWAGRAAPLLNKAADMIEANAPAVTVTEERCRAVYREACSGYEQSAWGDEDLAISAMIAIASEANSPRKSERDAVLEEAVTATNATLGSKTIYGICVRDCIRALKSTTPQTGSQE